MEGTFREALEYLTLMARHIKKTRGSLGGGVDLSKDQKLNPTNLKVKEDREIHDTIAELMIFANSSIATLLQSAFPLHAIVRCHPTEDASRLITVIERNTGIDLSNFIHSADALSFQEAIDVVTNIMLSDTPSSEFEQVDAFIKTLITQSVSRARYISNGDLSLEPAEEKVAATFVRLLPTMRFRKRGELSWDDLFNGTRIYPHFGLGVQSYTHFTSPIRRFADVVVHRQLNFILNHDHSTSSSTRENSGIVGGSNNNSYLVQSSKDNDNSIEILQNISSGRKLQTNSKIEKDSDDDDSDLDIDDFLDDSEEEEEEEEGQNNIKSQPLIDSIVEESLIVVEESKGGEKEDESLLYFMNHHLLNPLCNQMNEQHEKGKALERYAKMTFMALFVQSQGGLVTQGVVMKLREDGMSVFFPQYDINVFVKMFDKERKDVLLPEYLVENGQQHTSDQRKRQDVIPHSHLAISVSEDGGKLEVHPKSSKFPILFQVHPCQIVEINLGVIKHSQNARPPRLSGSLLGFPIDQDHDKRDGGGEERKEEGRGKELRELKVSLRIEELSGKRHHQLSSSNPKPNNYHENDMNIENKQEDQNDDESSLFDICLSSRSNSTSSSEMTSSRGRSFKTSKRFRKGLFNGNRVGCLGGKLFTGREAINEINDHDDLSKLLKDVDIEWPEVVTFFQFYFFGVSFLSSHFVFVGLR